MPCNHKFRSYLDLEGIDYEPSTLIVGTFNPDLPGLNNAEWFYGHTSHNHFWDVLPRLYGEASLIHATPTEWKQFCRDKQIAITDLISTIDDADLDNPAHLNALAGFEDKALIYNFDDFVFVNIIKILRDHPSIKNVYLTRGITEAFWKHLWNPVVHYCHQNNIRERVLLTPSDKSIHQQVAHNNQKPEEQIPLLQDYILMRWQQEWHL